MGQESREAGQELEGEHGRTPEQLREEIERTREELGDTVAALAQKTDVKAQARHAVDEAKATAAGKVSVIKESVPSGLARWHRGALIGVVGLGVAVFLGRGLRR